VERAAIATIPSDGGFALVRDADGGDGISGVAAEAIDELVQREADELPDLVGVVLHQSRSGEVLSELPIGEIHHVAVGADSECPHAGGPGVDGYDDWHAAA
jgi:hypothetical protein